MVQFFISHREVLRRDSRTSGLIHSQADSFNPIPYILLALNGLIKTYNIETTNTQKDKNTSC